MAHVGAGTFTLTRDTVGTRYAIAVVRYLVDFSDKDEVRHVHALQDAVKVSLAKAGSFEVPNWDEASLKKVRAALLQLGTTISDTRRMYGANRSDVDPVSTKKSPDGLVTIQFGGCDGKTPNCLPITDGWTTPCACSCHARRSATATGRFPSRFP